MIPVRLEHTFRGTRDQFWQVIFHPEYPAALQKVVGVKEFELVELEDHGDRITRIVRSEPERDLPAAIRKITGANLSYTEYATLHKAEHRHEFKVVLNKMPKRADIHGQYILEEPEPGRLLRHCQAEVSVGIPLLGKKIEKTIVADMEKTLLITAGVIQEWLDRLQAE